MRWSSMQYKRSGGRSRIQIQLLPPYIPKPTQLHPLIPRPTPKPTNLHPLYEIRLLPPDLLYCIEVLLRYEAKKLSLI